jgi:putative hydroxymethylpyrimidine transport system substrate-binding protein
VPDQVSRPGERGARGAALVALLVGAALVATGCGEREERLRTGEPEPFEVVLDSRPGADVLPIYAARAGGHLRDVGLDVRLRPATAPAAAIEQVASGRADLAITRTPELLSARQRGLGVIAVGALVQKPLSAIVSLSGERIATPADLEGKRVGTSGRDYQRAYLRTVIDDADLPAGSVTARDVGPRLLTALLARRVDAVLGAAWNRQALALGQRGRRPGVIRIDEAGVPPYDELVFVANADALEREGGGIRAFVAALARGEQDLRRNPDRALRALLADERGLSARLERESLRVTLPLFSPARGRPYGWQDPGEWDAFAEWMRDSGLIGDTDPRAAFTNDYLPGRGLRR